MITNQVKNENKKMKWKYDPLKYEKHMLFDGIIDFCKKFEGKDLEKVSVKDLSDFIDDFYRKHDDYCIKCKNEKIACVCMKGD